MLRSDNQSTPAVAPVQFSLIDFVSGWCEFRRNPVVDITKTQCPIRPSFPCPFTRCPVVIFVVADPGPDQLAFGNGQATAKPPISAGRSEQNESDQPESATFHHGPRYAGFAILANSISDFCLVPNLPAWERLSPKLCIAASPHAFGSWSSIVGGDVIGGEIQGTQREAAIARTAESAGGYDSDQLVIFVISSLRMSLPQQIIQALRRIGVQFGGRS